MTLIQSWMEINYTLRMTGRLRVTHLIQNSICGFEKFTELYTIVK